MLKSVVFISFLLIFDLILTLKTVKSVYEMVDDFDYEDDKNAMIATTQSDIEINYEDFYNEIEVEYVQDQSMDVLIYGPPESFMRMDSETILRIFNQIKKKKLIPINKVLLAWDIVTDGKTAAYLQARDYMAFGSLLNYVPEEDLHYANMGDNSVRKYFARKSDDLHFRKYGILVAAYRRYIGNYWYSNASKINQLGYMICGFPPSELKKISSKVMKELKSDVLGKLKKCNDEQIKTLYEIAVKPDVYGEPYRWTSHEITRIGLLLKCIPPKEMSSIQLDAMPAITEDVIKEFSQTKLIKFTQQQIVKMQPLTRRIFMLRVQLKESLDVNEITSKGHSFSVFTSNVNVIVMSIVIFIYVDMCK